MSGGKGQRLTQDDISLVHLLSDQIGRVSVPVYKLGLGVLASDLSTLLTVADKSSDFIFRMGVSNGIESITTDVASGS